MLIGVDEDWVYSGNRHFANYTDVKPGEYVFRVKGSNNDGIWNEEGISLSIIITPPFWQTGWFRLLMIFTVAGLIYGLHRYRVSRLLEIERMRTRIASDLHDDIGSTLTRISIYSELIQRSKNVAKITASAREIGAMSREIVVTLSDIVWSIDARYDTLGNLLDRMRDFAAKLFSTQPIKMNLKTTGLDTAKKIPANVRQNVYLIFKEALNNIFKHAHATEVSIDLKDIDGAFTMAIKDNGIGFDEKKIQKGNGLKNMKLRAGRIGGKLSLKSKDGVLIILTTRRI
jgi:signal transduction histidine kinase